MTAMSSVLDKKYLKIPCSEIQLGARFSAPVFFEDGKNIFCLLATKLTAKI